MKLAVLITHPIQYFAPVFRQLASCPGIELRVFFGSNHGSQAALDPHFRTTFRWDSNPAEGFPLIFLSKDNIRKLNSISGVLLGLKAAYEINIFHPDAVLVFSYSPIFIIIATLLLKISGNKLMLRAETTDKALERSWLKDVVRSMLLKVYYKQFFSVFPIGTNSIEHYTRMGVSPERQLPALYSIDVDYFNKQVEKWIPQRSKLRAAAGISSDAYILMYCGKMFPPKDPLIIPAALAILPAEKRANLWLIAVGDGNLRPEFEHLSSSYLDKRVIFTGFKNQSELGKYYAMADTLILPSKSGETWGLVVNEALQFGLRVIVSDKVGCGLDLARSEDGGQIFSSGNAASLAFEIEKATRNRTNAGMRKNNSPDPALLVKAILSATDKLKAGRHAKQFHNRPLSQNFINKDDALK